MTFDSSTPPQPPANGGDETPYSGASHENPYSQAASDQPYADYSQPYQHSGGVEGQPYPSQQYSAPGYQAASYSTPGYGMAPQHKSGATILVLGILSLIMCAPLGIAAWVMANNAIKEGEAQGVVYANAGQITAGKVLGMIATLLMIAALLIFLFVGGSTFLAFLGLAASA